MKVKFSEKYIPNKEDILSFIKNFDSNGKVLGKQSRNTIKLFKIDGSTLNIKSFKIPNLINQVVYRFFRKSKAERSYEHAQLLLKNNIGTPKPIAYIENPKTLLFKRSFYVCEHLEADLTYRELVRDANYPDRKNILEKFAKFTFKLHENGILFKDHSPGNTLIKKNGEDYDFFLVDLNRMEFKKLSFEERIKNFSRLTPHQEMVAIMSKGYADVSKWEYEAIFSLMWHETETFQGRYHRKQKAKKQIFFWRN